MTRTPELQRTVLIVEQRSLQHDRGPERPLVLFEFPRFRTALVGKIRRLQEPPPKDPMSQRVFNIVMDLVTLSFVFNRLAARRAERDPIVKRWRRQQEEMGPASLLNWLDAQTADEVVVHAEKWNLDWMLYRAIPGPPFLIMQEDDDAGSLSFIEAYCGECNLAFRPDQLATERWSYDHGPLAAAGGRQLVCPASHTILKVTDIQS